MNIGLTRDEYRRRLDLLYMADWVLHAYGKLPQNPPLLKGS